MLVLTIAGLGVAVATSRAQSPATGTDPVLIGYERLHQGDLSGASQYFEDQLKRAPDDLAFRFGWLMAEQARIQLAPGRTAQFEKDLDAIIALGEARYERTHEDVGALFYLANAYLMRAAYRFDHDKGMWGAARDGANAKSYVEAYLKVYPRDGDAYLVLGSYNYYVDIIPTFFKFMRLLMFLPSGNRVEGLKQLERASTEGRLFAPLARRILMEAYATFEGRTTEAIAMGEQLRQQYPGSDAAATSLAEVYASAGVEDHTRAAAIYEGIVQRHAAATSAEGIAARSQALLGLAGQRQEDFRIDDAIAILTPTIDAPPAQPGWVFPQFLLRRANFRALLDDPRASEDAKRVQTEAKQENFRKGAAEMVTWIDGRRASGEAARYAALVPPNRMVAEGKWDEARKVYDDIRAREPQNFLVQYRLAYLDFISGSIARALPEFVRLSATRAASESIRAMALLYVGRAYDVTGHRAEALKTYRQVVDDYDKQQRAADFARVGLLTPYKTKPARTP